MEALWVDHENLTVSEIPFCQNVSYLHELLTMHYFQSRFHELLDLMSSSDLSLATRRIMDLFDEFEHLHHLRVSAMHIRADYNMSRELGATELSNDVGEDIRDRLNILLNQAKEANESFEPSQNEPDQEVLFSGERLTKTFNSGGHYFELGPVDISLTKGRITGLVGENGNGKTTLLRQIAGILDHDSGTLSYALNDARPYEVRQKIAWIPQRSTRWYGTLLQNLRFMAASRGILGEENEFRVDYTIHRLGLTRFRELTWKQLSSGYKLRFELAKMVVWQPRLLVLDEPIANLDLQAQQLFLQDLRFLAGSRRNALSIILSSQQLHQIETVADDIMFLRNGKTIYYGPTRGFDDQRVQNVYELQGAFERKALLAALGEDIILGLDDTGINFRLTTPRTVNSPMILQKIGTANLELSYFRDISTSTRKLFHQDP